jgi:hypothetical protein
MQKKIIVTLGCKKIANSFAENLSESPKIAIITLTPVEWCTQFVDGRDQGGQIGGFAQWMIVYFGILKNTEIAHDFGPLCFKHRLYINFDKNWATFWRFFHKLIWSPWARLLDCVGRNRTNWYLRNYSIKKTFRRRKVCHHLVSYTSDFM